MKKLFCLTMLLGAYAPGYAALIGGDSKQTSNVTDAEKQEAIQVLAMLKTIKECARLTSRGTRPSYRQAKECVHVSRRVFGLMPDPK